MACMALHDLLLDYCVGLLSAPCPHSSPCSKHTPCRTLSLLFHLVNLAGFLTSFTSLLKCHLEKTSLAML